MDLSAIGSIPFSSDISIPDSQQARENKLEELEKSMKKRLERLSVK